jgi:hypothetical protein
MAAQRQGIHQTLSQVGANRINKPISGVLSKFRRFGDDNNGVKSRISAFNFGKAWNMISKPLTPYKV